MIQRTVSLFIQYILGFFVLDVWLKAFYKRRVSVGLYIVYTFILIVAGIIYSTAVPMGFVKLLAGASIQFLYAILIFENKSFKKLIIMIGFTLMANIYELIIIFVLRVILKFYENYDMFEYSTLLSIMLSGISYVLVQIVLEVKNRHKEN